MRWLLFVLTGFLGFESVSIIPDDARIFIEGTVHQESVQVQYGSIHFDDGDIGAYFRFEETETGQIIDEQIYNTDRVDSFQYVADIGDGEFLFVCKQLEIYNHVDRLIVERYLIFHYSLNDKELEFITFVDTSDLSFHNYNHLLVLVDADGDVEYMDKNGFVEVVIQPSEEYTGTYSMQFQGQAYVNQEPVEAICLEEPGYYDILICDGEYLIRFQITLHPDFTVEGERFNDYYLGEVRLISKGILYLNNQPYQSGDVVSISGFYLFQIFGANGYENELEFTILPSVEYYDGLGTYDLKEGSQFDIPIKIYSNAVSMMLDDSMYYSEIIDATGYHSLTLYGVGGFSTEIGFVIYPSVLGLDGNGSFDRLDLVILGDAYINGEFTTGAIVLEEPGDYLLELMFEGDLYQTYQITILSSSNTESPVEKDFSYWNIIFIVFAGVGGYYILRKK